MTRGYAKFADREKTIAATQADYDRLKVIGEYLQELTDAHDREFMEVERRLQNHKQSHQILCAVEVLDFWIKQFNFAGPVNVPEAKLQVVDAALRLPYLFGDTGHLADAQAEVEKWVAAQNGYGPNTTITVAGLELVRSVLWKDKAAPTTERS